MKKGFTLIELLAVIVILAVIGLIVTPTLIGYIEKSRISSYRSSVQTLIEKTKEYVSKTEENNDFPVGGIDITKVDLNLKNAEFKNGVIEKDEKGQIYARNVYNGRYCANGTKNNLVVERVDNLDDCKSVDATPPEIKKIIINNVTSTSITVVALASDAQSGIKEFEYCIGDECIKQNKNNYTFKNLKPNTEYEITVKVRNNNYGTSDQYTKEVTETSKKIKATTNIVEKPKFKVSSLTYSSSKKVTIIYPKKEEGYEYSYKMLDTKGQIIKEEIINKESQELIINENCTIIAYIKVGTEEVSEAITIIGIDGKGPEVTVINLEKWEKVKQLEVRAVDTGSGLAKKAYSYDGGKSWTSNNKRAFQENTRVKLLVRDKLGNITNKYKVCKNSDGTNCEDQENEIIIDSVDTVNPECELTVTSGTKGTNGWYTSNVTIGFKSVTDKAKDVNGNLVEGSGVVSQSLNIPTVTNEGQTTITGTVVDKVGNKGTCSIKVNVDKTKPTCQSSGGSTSWTKNSRTLVGTCADTGGSGCLSNISTPVDYEIASSGMTPGTVSDRAGNKTTCPANQPVYIDKTKPTCTSSGGPTSWTKGSRTLVGTCADKGGSGCAGNASRLFNSEGLWTNQSPGTVSDRAGNKVTCPANQTVGIDRTPPSVAYSANQGWTGSGYPKGTTIQATCTDTISGVASGSTSKTFNTLGANTIAGTCTDNAGNSTPYSSSYNAQIYTVCSGTSYYNSCMVGSNSCQGGYVCNSCYKWKTCAHSACGCKTFKMYSSEGACTRSSSCKGKFCYSESGNIGDEWTCGECKTYKSCQTAECGSELVSNNCDRCGKTWSDCATGSNVCYGGYDLSAKNYCWSTSVGWLAIGNTWVYRNNDGSLATGWLNLNGTWYYLKSNGAMITGWLYLNSTWYYLETNGAMVTGWKQIGGTWYYFYSSGAMATNTTIDGWYCNGSGACTI